jgi:diguanylate cyclase (GGDEF)-like protein
MSGGSDQRRRLNVPVDYRAVIRHTPQPHWIEDHSRARARLEELGLLTADAVPWLAAYLVARPALLSEIVGLVEIIDVNDATLRRYGFETLDELRAGLGDLYTDVSYALYAGFWEALAGGRLRFRGEDDNLTTRGVLLRQEVCFAADPDEPDWGRVIVTDVDVTGRTLTERSTRLQRDAAVALAACEEPSTLPALLIDMLLAVEDVTAAAVYLSDPQSDDFLMAEQLGFTPEFAAAARRFELSSPRMPDVGAGDAMVMPGDRFAALFGNVADRARSGSTKLRSVALVPVRYLDQLVAVVCAASRTVDRLAGMTLQLIEGISATAGASLARLAAQRDAERRLKYLSALGDVQRTLLARGGEGIGPVVLPRLLEVSGADRVYLFRELRDDLGRDCLDQLAEVVAPGVQSQLDNPKLRSRPWEDLSVEWHAMLLRGEPVAGSPADFPAQACDMLEQDILSMLMLPLFVHGELFGMVGFDNCHSARPWNVPEIALLSAVAASISAALEQDEALERLRDESSRLQALLAAGSAIASSLDYEEVLKSVVRRSGEALAAPECILWEYLPESNEVVFRALYERAPEPGLADKLRGRRYTLEDARHEHELLSAGEVREYTISDPELPDDVRVSMEKWHEKTLLSVPLVLPGTALGELILIETTQERSFTEAERELARGLGELAGAALTNAKLHTRVQHQLAVRHDLLELGEALLRQLDEQQVFDQIAHSLTTLVEHDALELALVDPITHEAVVVHAVGKDAGVVMGQSYPSDAGVTGRVLRSGAPELVNDMLHDPDAVVVPGTDREEQASLIVPLRLGKDTAVLTVDRFSGRAFSEDELETVRLFASLAAVALENARLYRAAEEQAISDGLTGLYNHRHFYERLEQEMARAQRAGEPLALLMIDLDDFKQYNDRHGHPAGDEVLRVVGRVLRGTTRRGVDLAARYGGEEFAVILPATVAHAPAGADDGEPRSAVAVAERIRAAVADEQLSLPNGEAAQGGVTVSVGVAVLPTTAQTMGELVAQADAALYLAKRRGKDRVEVYGIR